MANPNVGTFEGTNEQQAIQKSLVAKLATIGCPCFYSRMEVGPVITAYFFIPYPTTSLAKIMSKTEDLALSVGAESILVRRDLDAISISVPNANRTIISFDKCLYNLISAKSQSTLPILMGVDTKGNDITIDLCEQPHVLIAGSTGSGKSVFLSQVITSLAVTKEPSELQLYLVDTKKLDLTLFASLKHVEGIVTKIEDLHNTLEDLLMEVRKRTKEMQGKARNIAEWNAIAGKTVYGHKMMYKVLIIDELADVISQDKELARDEDKNSKRKRISAALTELAQISRAAGIHIIAATQRPSVQIINGDIKTNFPTRICFKLPSQIDSRVVLDENGAENLLGKGDYLYKTSTDSTLRRAHSAFVQMSDIQRIVEQNEFIRMSLQHK